MRKILILFTAALLIVTCSKDKKNNPKNQKSNNTTNTTTTKTTKLEGKWRLQNMSRAAQLIFKGNVFVINSGSVTIKGTFTLSGNKMNGIVTSRSGANSDASQPDNFNGKYKISDSGNRVSFSDFSGNWRAPFSSWYQKE